VLFWDISLFNSFIKLSESQNLSCNERFLLAAIMLFRVSDCEYFTAKQLSEWLSVSQYMAASGLNALARAGCVSRGGKDSHPNSKSSQLYKLGAQAGEFFGEESWAGQKELVGKLLLGEYLRGDRVSGPQKDSQPAADGQPPARIKSDAPLPSLRLTLAILAGYSDMFGRVFTGDSRSLRKLTGLSVARYRNHLRQAEEELKVLHVVPGVSSRWFKPAKQTSTFYLNLLDYSLSSGRLLYDVSSSRDIFTDQLEQTCLEAVKRLVDSLRKPEVALLVSRMLHEASLLLSRHWGQLDSPRGFYDSQLQDSELIRRIGQFLAVPQVGEGRAGWAEDLAKSLHSELAFFIIEIACLVKCWMLRGGAAEVVYRDIQVRPFKQQAGEYYAQIHTVVEGHSPSLIMISVD
jgi:hypothetical protein